MDPQCSTIFNLPLDPRIKWKIPGLRVRDIDPLRVVPGRASAVKICQINYVVISRELGLSICFLNEHSCPHSLPIGGGNVPWSRCGQPTVGSGTGMKCEACLGTAVRGLGGVSEGN